MSGCHFGLFQLLFRNIFRTRKIREISRGLRSNENKIFLRLRGKYPQIEYRKVPTQTNFQTPRFFKVGEHGQNSEKSLYRLLFRSEVFGYICSF